KEGANISAFHRRGGFLGRCLIREHLPLTGGGHDLERLCGFHIRAGLLHLLSQRLVLAQSGHLQLVPLLLLQEPFALHETLNQPLRERTYPSCHVVLLSDWECLSCPETKTGSQPAQQSIPPTALHRGLSLRTVDVVVGIHNITHTLHPKLAILRAGTQYLPRRL